MTTHPNHPLPHALRDEPDAPELEQVWRLLGQTVRPSAGAPEPDRAWEVLSHRLATAQLPPRDDTNRGVPARALRPGAVLLRAAAVVLLALGGSAAWYAVPVTRSAGPGERIALTLPDGSDVELNAGSTLRYRRGFQLLPGLAAGSRGVRLDGEAFFQVEPGVRPFRVSAGGATVRVLGTRFNVRARAGKGREPGLVRVEVEEGRVEVWGTRARSAVILGAGEGARVVPGTPTPTREELAPERIGSWRSGGLTVVDESLSSILSELGLRFGVRILLSDPEAGAAHLSIYYPSVASLESVLADLATQQDLRYRRTNDGWELF